MRKTTILKSMLLGVVLLITSAKAMSEKITLDGTLFTTIDEIQTITTSDIEFSGKLKQYTTSKLWLTSGSGYIYNKTSLGSITKITLKYNTGGSGAANQRFNVGNSAIEDFQSTGGTLVTTSNGGTSYEFTGGTGFGFFNISVSNKNLQLVSLEIEYTPGSSTPTVSTPTITPATGTYYSTQSVSISSSTADATIYYTTDGSTPDDTKTVYSAPFDVASTTTVNAIAYKAGMNASGIASTTITIESAPSTTGDGSQQNPFTIGDVKTMNRQTSDGNKYWVKGYIVGVVAGGNNEGNISSLENPVKGVSNLALADAADATDLTTMIAVQLPTGTIRSTLNLVDNPDNLGKLVFVYGTLEKYFGTVPGVKYISEFAWDSTTGINKTQTLNSWSNGNTIYLNATAGESIEVYNIAGQKIISKTANEGINSINHNEKGVVIVKAGSRVSKLVIR